MELGSPWDGAIFILIQFQKPFCPFSLGVLKNQIFPKDTQAKKEKERREEKRKEKKRKEKDKGTNRRGKEKSWKRTEKE
jgi:hypothetical protein